MRQFLFVYPDWFVVFDRVMSKAADQKQTWLFHTQYESVETGDTFRAEHRNGAVCVRTLLPRDRSSEKSGRRTGGQRVRVSVNSGYQEDTP